MAVTVYVPSDTTACALGADEVAVEITAQARVRGIDIELVRNGSRGAFWLEPLVEVETHEGRQAFGSVTPDDVAGMFDAGFPGSCRHSTALGPVDEVTWLSRKSA